MFQNWLHVAQSYQINAIKAYKILRLSHDILIRRGGVVCFSTTVAQSYAVEQRSTANPIGSFDSFLAAIIIHTNEMR